MTDNFVKPLDSSGGFAFVCGCGHSGTTLLAAKVGNHPKVLLIGRESEIFLPNIGLASAKAVLREWRYFAALGSKSVIVEKTPRHVHVSRRILRVAPDARLIVTVRNPLDNVASLVRRFKHFNACVERWIEDNRAVLKLLRSDNSLLIKYEDLTTHPAVALERVTGFLGLEWSSQILRMGETAYSVGAVDRNMVVRASQVQQSIKSNFGVWNRVLDRSQAMEVVDRTRAVATALGYDMDNLLTSTAGVQGTAVCSPKQ